MISGLRTVPVHESRNSAGTPMAAAPGTTVQRMVTTGSSAGRFCPKMGMASSMPPGVNLSLPNITPLSDTHGLLKCDELVARIQALLDGQLETLNREAGPGM